MGSKDEKAEVEFDLPYEPYPNQLVFMKDAYDCFDNSRFGLFESPTGSGKTLSILCSALTWLKNNRARTLMCGLDFEASNGTVPRSKIYLDESVPKWVAENALKQRRQMAEEIIRSEALKLENLRKKISEKIDSSDGRLRLRSNYKRLQSDPAETDEREEVEGTPRTQIIICSRTFSQLNQYVKELKKLVSLAKNVKLAMGCGRTHVCINKHVKNRCRTSDELNEECRATKCEFRPNAPELSELSTCYPLDLEDLVRFGQEMEACPYYSNLRTLSTADVVLAPYVTIVNESMRESLGISIKDNIVIFDEGHNLVDAVAESHSCKLTLPGLKELLVQLKGYCAKYKQSLTAILQDRLGEIISLVTLISSKLSEATGTENMKITSFTVRYSLEHVKFHEILNFLSSTEFCRHLRGYAERVHHAKIKANEANNSDPGCYSKEGGREEARVRVPSHTSMIYTLKNFIYALLYCDENDQVLVTRDEEAVVEIFPVASVAESRAVILMSGTLSPMEQFLALVPPKTEHLVHKSPPVFPQERFLAVVLDKDSSGKELVFDYARRENERELGYLCELMLLLSETVPNGVVCFFSSYAYLNSFHTFFTNSSSYKRVLENKSLFKEQQNVNVFPEYAKNCQGKGAILMAVFGGNQSEGVDFADELARLVLLVGVPYPQDNIKLRLKRDYYQRKSAQSASELSRSNYANLATNQRTILSFKTVNQCIGRAMRHRRDFAAVLLLDARYRGAQAERYLSKHVTESVRRNSGLAEDLGASLRAFYARQR